MTELQWGIPIQGGETRSRRTAGVALQGECTDGTRRIEPHRYDGRGELDHWRLWSAECE